MLHVNLGILSSITGLDHYGDKLYWTDKTGDAIRWVEKEPPYYYGVFLANKEFLRSISIYHNNRTMPGNLNLIAAFYLYLSPSSSPPLSLSPSLFLSHKDTHPCFIANGGCSHMCVGVSSGGEGFIPSCLCPTGYLLQQDKKNCAECKQNKNYIIYTSIFFQ